MVVASSEMAKVACACVLSLLGGGHGVESETRDIVVLFTARFGWLLLSSDDCLECVSPIDAQKDGLL
jgi:hypothetical protein